MDQIDYDVIIVGAGPSGSIAAERLARNNISVLILDSKKFPRYKCCAAGVLWHNMEDFPEIKDVVENFNYKLVTHSPSLNHKFSIESDDHYLMGQTYRVKLDSHLVNLAQKAGAIFQDRTKVIDLEIMDESKGVRVTAKIMETGESKNYIAKVIVGADGVTSIVRKKHPDFPDWKKDELLIASELDVPIDEEKILEIYGKERAVHMFLYYNDVPGYAWIFTKKHSVSIGMGTMLEFEGKTYGGRVLRENFAHYCKFLKNQGYIPEGTYDLEKTSYAMIPCTSLKTSVTYGQNALLVGDAAGAFVSALSGEGIYYGCLSGKFAAECIIEAFEKNRFDEDQLSLYKKLWMKRLKTELNYQYFAKGYMVEVKRRCEKAVRWGRFDKKIRKFMSVFFTGVYQIDRKFMIRLICNYIRLKIKDLFGMLGEREKKSDYN